MTDKRKYKIICKKYRKKLKKIAKETYPWDYCSILDYTKTCLEFMKEYYTLGYNIFSYEHEASEENKGKPNRLKTITKALDEYQAYFNTRDKYFKIIVTPNTSTKSKIGNIKVERLIEDPDENEKACAKEEQKHWDTFWKLVSKYIQYWWD